MTTREAWLEENAEEIQAATWALETHLVDMGHEAQEWDSSTGYSMLEDEGKIDVSGGLDCGTGEWGIEIEHLHDDALPTIRIRANMRRGSGGFCTAMRNHFAALGYTCR